MSMREGVHRVKGYSIVVLTGTDALPLDTSRASLQRVTRISRYTSRFDRTGFVNLWNILVVYVSGDGFLCLARYVSVYLSTQSRIGKVIHIHDKTNI